MSSLSSETVLPKEYSTRFLILSLGVHPSVELLRSWCQQLLSLRVPEAHGRASGSTGSQGEGSKRQALVMYRSFQIDCCQIRFGHFPGETNQEELRQTKPKKVRFENFPGRSPECVPEWFAEATPEPITIAAKIITYSHVLFWPGIEE